MKKIKFTLFALAMLIMAGFSSCNKDQDTPVDINGDVVLTVSSTANATRVSGEADNKWDGNEEIGLFCADLEAKNARFLNNSNGTEVVFQPVGQADKIILKGDHTVTYKVFAYYPYDANAAADKVVYDLATAGKQPILWASADVTRINPNAAFAFAHKLGKLVIKIANDSDVTIDTDLAVTLKDAQTNVTLNPRSGDVTADATTTDLPLNKVENENSFYSFVMPSGATDRALTIVNDGKTYTATLSALAFVANTRNTYIVTLKSESVVVDNEGGSKIDGTTPGQGGNVDATDTPTGIILSLPKEGNVYTANVASAANELTINVTNDNVDNIVLTGADNSWISLKAGQTGVELRAAKDVVLNIAENTGAARESNITLTIADKTVDFVIKQAAGDTSAPATTLSVDKPTLTFAATPAGTQDVAVTTNATSWDVVVDTSASAWLTATKNGDIITISATEYKDTNADRSGKITVTAGDKTATITVTQTKAEASASAGNWLFPNNDLASYVTFEAATLNGKIDNTAGKDGHPGIVVNGTSTSNSTNWRTTVPAMSGTPKSISFFIKGNTSKDLVVRFANSASGFANLGYSVSKGLDGTTLTSSSFAYGATIDASDWTKITLDISTETIQPEGGLFFEIRHGKGGTFNYVISDFEVQY